MTKQSEKPVLYYLLMDASMSMRFCWEEMLDALYQHLEYLNKVNRKFPRRPLYFSCCFFNSEITICPAPVMIHQARKILPDVSPDGKTALYDAIGKSILSLKKWLNTDRFPIDTEVVMIILTDGHDNSSVDFRKADVVRIFSIMHRIPTWHVGFLGAGFSTTAYVNKILVDGFYSHIFDKRDMDKAFEQLNLNFLNYISAFSSTMFPASMS